MRTRIRHGLAAALAVSALSLTAACGGGDAKDDTKKAADKPAAGQSASSEPTSAAPAAPATPLTATQMKAGVLELKDLPSGWKAAKADGPAITKVDKPECEPIAGLLAEKLSGATLGGSGDFALGGTTTLNQEVVTFPGTGATDFVQKLGTALGACTGFGAEAEGMKLTATVEKLTAPEGAEEAHALRLKLSIPDVGYTNEMNLLVARQGAGLTRLSHDPATAVAHKDFGTFAKLATDKFVKAAQS